MQPAAGSARVRLIQGAPAAAAVSVTAVGGPLLARGLTYGAITGYADVPQGHWDLKVTENGASHPTNPLDQERPAGAGAAVSKRLSCS